ncbi:MAG: T9SS type A sorting domain-containing protein [Bacteroidetes bacterium]|nr:T9SS type A sorting domain-containing protein [Bacteroidota bacterium]
MNYKLFLLIFGWSFITVSAQFGPQQIISNTSPFPSRSIPLDIDNDGFIDVLTSSDYKLKWFRNLDGQGSFSDEIIISNNIALYLTINFVDIDSDGDNDLVYLENNPRKLEWLENLDGQGNFGPVQVILENQPNYIFGVRFTDIDDDDDLDLVINYSDTFSEWIVWYENIDGQGTFGNETVLIENNIITEIYSPLFVDIDNDGLLDMLTSYEEFSGPAKLVWYKNLGNTTFGQEQLIYQFQFIQSDATSIYSINYIDINSDNNPDIFITSHNDDIGTLHYWLENLNNQGEFNEIQFVPNVLGFYSFYDLDNDGDNDILGGTRFGDIFYWMKNEDGLGDFSDRIIISTEIDNIADAKAADFNEDGLLDVVSASSVDNKIAWYENEGLGIEDNSENIFNLYPNPTNGKLQINTTQEIILIEVYSLVGQKVLETKTEINLSNLVSGVYFVKIENENGFSEVHKIIKE